MINIKCISKHIYRSSASGCPHVLGRGGGGGPDQDAAAVVINPFDPADDDTANAAWLPVGRFDRLPRCASG